MASTNEPTPLLDPVKIIETIATLRLRVQERFPNSGLGRVCDKCLEIGKQAQQRSVFIDRPIYWLRTSIWLLIVFLSITVLVAIAFLPRKLADITEDWQTIEAISSQSLLIAAGLFFLMSLEKRFKRRRALAAIHELRSVAHVIDMHQLTKDPERLLRNWVSSQHSPKLSMSSFELGRYLDYCVEMLSLLGKIAAVYVQRFDDEVALEAASEVEMLINGLVVRIWQKTMLLSALESQIVQSRSKEVTDKDDSPAVVVADATQRH